MENEIIKQTKPNQIKNQNNKSIEYNRSMFFKNKLPLNHIR